jgi:hypothetical protein
MSAKNWPKITQVTKHEKLVWMVDARVAGKGERRFFPVKREAEGWAQQQVVKRTNQGFSAFDDRELAAFGWSVPDAIRFVSIIFAGRPPYLG